MSTLSRVQDQFNSKLEEYAPWDSVRGVYKEFNGYVKTSEMQDLQEKVD
jgi:hypothetical protein